LVLPVSFLSVQLGLRQREAEEGSFNVNHFIFLKGVRVELFPPPPKPPRCDFKQYIDDYMTPSDGTFMTWGKKNSAMGKDMPSSK
jgi:hypothetical protein